MQPETHWDERRCRQLGPDDDLDQNELLKAVVELINDSGDVESGLRDSLPNHAPSRVAARRAGKRDLIAESQHIRNECDELVRRYEAAVAGTRDAAPRRQAPVAPAAEPRSASPAARSDRAGRRKALLLLLIEELL